jgi:polygalacturonase
VDLPATYLDVRKLGARGDGVSLDTPAIQAALDQASRQGGGTVLLPPGHYLSGALLLRSGVRLEITAGATLEAVADASQFPPRRSPVYSRMDVHPWKVFLYGEDLEDVTLSGDGRLLGGGQHACFRNGIDNSPERPYGIHLIRSRRIQVRGLRLGNSGFWMQRYFACQDIHVHGVQVYNHSNFNNDGIDLDSCDDVRVSDCQFDAMDDTFCLKSEGKAPTRNVTITNCIAATHASAYKLGTGSLGGFENIVISNCTVRRSRATEAERLHVLGAWGGLAAVDIASVDGGHIRNVVIDNLVVDGVETPVFIKLGNRMSRHVDDNYAARADIKPADEPAGSIDGVTISNLRAINAGPIASAIAGFEGHPVRNVTLRDVDIRCSQPGTAADITKPVNWSPRSYPCNRVWGTNLPAYGLVLRHVEGITLERVRVVPAPGEERPAFFEEFSTGRSGSLT